MPHKFILEHVRVGEGRRIPLLGDCLRAGHDICDLVVRVARADPALDAGFEEVRRRHGRRERAIGRGRAVRGIGRAELLRIAGNEKPCGIFRVLGRRRERL